MSLTGIYRRNHKYIRSLGGIEEDGDFSTTPASSGSMTQKLNKDMNRPPAAIERTDPNKIRWPSDTEQHDGGKSHVSRY